MVNNPFNINFVLKDLLHTIKLTDLSPHIFIFTFGKCEKRNTYIQRNTSHSFNVFIIKPVPQQSGSKWLQHNQYATQPTQRTHTHLTKQTNKQMQQKNKHTKQTITVGGPRCFFVPLLYRNPVPGTYFHGHKN